MHRRIMLFGALLLSLAFAAPAKATPSITYGFARDQMCGKLQPYAQAWMDNHGFGTIFLANSGVSYNRPDFWSFVRDDGATWTVQCQWLSMAAPGYHNPYAAAGDENYNEGRVAATAPVGGVWPNSTINLAAVDWWYLNWMDPNCPQCWADVPYGTRYPTTS